MKNISKFSTDDLKAIRKSDNYILLVDQCSDIADDLQILSLRAEVLKAILAYNHYRLADVLGYAENSDFSAICKNLTDNIELLKTFRDLYPDDPCVSSLNAIFAVLEDCNGD